MTKPISNTPKSGGIVCSFVKSGSIVCSFVMLTFYIVYTNATCPIDGRRTLMHRDKLDMVDIGTYDVIADYTPHIVAFLDTCTFTPLPDKPMFGQCQAACNRNRDCLAMYLTTATGCELCLATASGAGGNGNDYDVRKMLIMAEALRDFINGKPRHITLIFQSVWVFFLRKLL